MKKLALFDIDGVIYGGHVIFGQIQSQEKSGLIVKGTWDKVHLLLEEYKSGQKNYKQAADKMLEVYAEALKGIDYKEIVESTSEYLDENKDKFFSYFAEIIPQIKEEYDIYFVTTNFQFACEGVCTMFGLKDYLSSIAEVKDGKFTGKVELSLAGSKGVVADLVTKYGKSGSFAVGDSENDAEMLDKVEFPFVMEPNDKLVEIADEKGWSIVDRDDIADAILDLI
ncbi:MAG: haloacid dehalogenase-like hydrolase [Candidatus Woesebacteria bacterium]|nr:MAG: haloacid dehalogenase-like hydrolase [Candidatus Woesebacteria bacterium]